MDEGFDVGGHLTLAGACFEGGDGLPNFLEIGHVVSDVSSDDESAMARLESHFLETVGRTDGNSRTEVIVTPCGPRIVESHNRPGGDGIP